MFVVVMYREPHSMPEFPFMGPGFDGDVPDVFKTRVEAEEAITKYKGLFPFDVTQYRVLRLVEAR